MEEQNFSTEIFDIMAREMGIIGEYIVKNQCFEIGIMYNSITWEDVPRLSKALSEVMMSFGEEKARKILEEIENLVNIDTLLAREQDPLARARMYSQLGDSSAITGNNSHALDYYKRARACAEGIKPAIAEIDKRIEIISSRK